MSASIDLSGTARLPAAPELLKAAAALRKHTSDAGETMQLAHSAWSFLAGAYTAPEQQQVHRAMDRPRHDGQALAAAGSRAAEALETFAAAVEGIRRQCLELQDDMEQLQEREQPVAGGGVQPAGMVTPLTLAGQLLQTRANQLARDLTAAEDHCIRALEKLAGMSVSPR